MKYILFACLAILFFTYSNAQELVSNSEKEIVFRSVNVIPMDKNQVLPNQDVVVKNGKIVSIQASGKTKVPADALVVDGKGRYLIPGLAEMHAHVPPSDDLQAMKDVVLLFALKGVTTIRGMLGHPKHLELRKMINEGQIIAPKFYTSGPSFNGQSVGSPEAGAQMVKDQKAAGYDFLKIHPGLSVEKFNAIVTTARAQQIPFAGHVPFAVGIQRAIDAGYASIDHMDGFIEALVPGINNITEQEEGIFGIFIAKQADVNRIPAMMQQLKQKNIWIVPTQALAERWFAPVEDGQFRNAPEMVYMTSDQLNNWSNSKRSLMNNQQYNEQEVKHFINLRRKLISDCNKYGVGLLSGSDAPQVFNVPGFSLHQELGYMVQAGLTPYEALRSSTLNVANYFGTKDRGTIRAGNVSDLVLLNGNPLADISQTTNIEGVMIGTRWMPKSFINQELQKLERSGKP